MGRIREYVMGVIADVMAEVKHDPFGTLTLAQAVELMTGDMDQITVAEAERIYSLADQINKVSGGSGVSLPTQTQTAAPEPGYGEPVTDPDELQKIAEQFGFKPGQFVAYKTPVGSEPEYVDTVNGRVKSSDIPRDENGQPTKEWVEANCNCPEHQAKRRQNAPRSREGDGGYI